MSKADKEPCTISSMIEKLQQADDCASFCLGDLQAALREASATESLLLLPMIKAAAELQLQIRALNEALRADHNVPPAAVDRLNQDRMVEKMIIELAETKENVAEARENATKAIDAFLRKDQELSDALRVFNAAINFSLDHAGPEGLTFLGLWREGSWESIAEEFPEFDLRVVGEAVAA